MRYVMTVTHTVEVPDTATPVHAYDGRIVGFEHEGSVFKLQPIWEQETDGEYLTLTHQEATDQGFDQDLDYTCDFRPL